MLECPWGVFKVMHLVTRQEASRRSLQNLLKQNSPSVSPNQTREVDCREGVLHSPEHSAVLWVLRELRMDPAFILSVMGLAEGHSLGGLGEWCDKVCVAETDGRATGACLGPGRIEGEFHTFLTARPVFHPGPTPWHHSFPVTGNPVSASHRSQPCDPR